MMIEAKQISSGSFENPHLSHCRQQLFVAHALQGFHCYLTSQFGLSSVMHFVQFEQALLLLDSARD
jgi:hypothetical protein